MNNFVITIGREFGSGGHAIAKKLAEYYGVKCYDKEIISMAAEHSGIHEDFIASCDEKAVSSFAFSVANNYYFSGSGAQQIQIKAYFSQFEAIKKLAESESFVIVGRVADYVLRHKENKISIFISADLSDRIDRVMEYEKIPDKKAEKIIAKADKNRAKYYNFFSHNKWGDAKTYDICVNSSVLGIEKTTDYLIKYIDAVLKEKGIKDWFDIVTVSSKLTKK